MFVVANRLPVAVDREDEFEALVEDRVHDATNQPGCRRVELLEPIDAEYYVIQAYWESRDAFNEWRSSDAFQKAHADLPADLFTGPNQLELYDLTTEFTGE